ncbi:MAG: S-layer homology domain-containing protein [Solibacillus sp.]
MMKYKKTMVSTLVAFSLFVTPLASNAQFTDVPDNASYKDAVNKLVKYKVLGGYSDGTFKPHASVTRAQAASIMAKALALDLSRVQAPGFKDVLETNGHYAAIAKLTELGVFSKAEKFNPNSPITRVQMAKMLVEAFDLKSEALQTFSDVKKTDWYYEPVGVLGALKITRNAEKFEPAGLVTRAHFATFVERVITMKRADGLADRWDTWGMWDERGIIAPLVEQPVKQPEKKPEQPVVSPAKPIKETNKEVKEMVQRLKTMTSELADVKVDVEDALEDLQKAIEKEKKQKTIDAAKKELSEELQNLEKLLTRASALVEQAEVLDDAEVNQMLDKLRAEIRRATKVSTESYADTFDKDYYEERFRDAADDLADAVKAAKKGLDNKSFTSLKKAHQELTKQIQAAEYARELYKDSNVKVLQDADRSVADAIKEAEDVLKQSESWFEDRLSDQFSNFKGLFKDALRELDQAVDDGKNSKIYDAKENVERIVKNAQKVVDDYNELMFDGIEKDKTKLQKEIDDAKKELRNADKK